MNILIPDSALREFLKTEATPKQLKEYLSLCGPSIERMQRNPPAGGDDDVVYNIEVTGNRPDAMSVSGIAREAAAILPQFSIPATYINDPYTIRPKKLPSKKYTHTLQATVDSSVCPRFTAMVLTNITVGPSPAWLQTFLEKSGIRSINTVVDITNYLMRAYGQPCHAFDFSKIKKEKGSAIMNLRLSHKGETLQTLDGKTHTLPGNDIVIEDRDGDLIDLCGIMGGYSSQIDEKTTEVLLFVQTYDPSHIRKTSMALSHRTEASGLFEKGLDTELVLPTITKGIELLQSLCGGTIASPLYDIYPDPYTPRHVSVSFAKIQTYLGLLPEIKNIKTLLETLGFGVTHTKDTLTVSVPSFRRDVSIDVDVIEEIARMYGYHNLPTNLPDTEPPMIIEDPYLSFEGMIKKTLKGWGYTETYTYSMISEKLMDIYDLDKTKTYTIANPLSQEWVYMRPTLLPSMLEILKYNLSFEKNLTLFELSMVYQWQDQHLPKETPMLIVGVTGEKFYEMKGLAEALCTLVGVSCKEAVIENIPYFHPHRSLVISEYGVVGEIHPKLLQTLGINDHVTVLMLDIQAMFDKKTQTKTYIPVPKYPASFEDIAFVVPEKFHIGPLMKDILSLDTTITDVSLLDSYKNIRTLHITYQSDMGNLTQELIQPIRKKILHLAETKYHATLKTT